MAIAQLATVADTSFSAPGPTGRHTIGALDPGGVTPTWVLIFGFSQNTADFPTAAEWDGIDIPLVTGGTANDTAAEVGCCRAFFKAGGGWGSASANAVIFGTPSSLPNISGIAICGTGTSPTVYGVLLEQEDQALTEENISDSPAVTNSIRYAGLWTGITSAAPTVGANSTSLGTIAVAGGLSGGTAVKETSPGNGSRPVGWSAGSDDVAAVYLAVAETSVVPPTTMPRVGRGRRAGN